MSVKSDSKGRLTGADPSTRYTRNVSSDGTITYVPEVPKTFDSEREVSQEEFEMFFGVAVNEVAEGGIQTAPFGGDRGIYFPHGIAVTRFVLDKEGRRVYLGQEAVKQKTFIRIKR